MLDEKLRAAEASLGNCEEDLEFLREQITVRQHRSTLYRGEGFFVFLANFSHRPLRSRQQEFTIGMLHRSGKRKRRVKVTMTTTRVKRGRHESAKRKGLE